MLKNIIEPELKELLPVFLIKNLNLDNMDMSFDEESDCYFHSNSETIAVSTESPSRSPEFECAQKNCAWPNRISHCEFLNLKPASLQNYNPKDTLFPISITNRIELVKFLKTQSGSRYFQEKVLSNKAKPSFLYQIVENIGSDLANIMINSYGNYLCKLIFQRSDIFLRMKILNQIRQNFVEICCDNCGVHTIGILIINATSMKEKQLLMQMINSQEKVLKLCLDVNGSQIIHLLITLIAEQDREFLNEVIMGQFGQLAMDINGIYILKKIITASPSERLKKMIIQKASAKIFELSRNHLGHYLPLYIFDAWGIDSIFAKDLLKTIKRATLRLAKYKHSSSLIEKLLEVLDNEQKFSLIKEILLKDGSSELLENIHGIKVLKKAIICLNPIQKRFTLTHLLNKISMVSMQMKSISHNCQIGGIAKTIELIQAESWQ